jgi:5-methylthioadenosine/S-adenosylhomocysteine deaminase
MMQAVDLIVRAGVVLTMDKERRLIRDGALAIRGKRILAVDKATAIAERYRAERTIGDRGKIVFPGLIDCHNHPVHFLSKGMIDDMRYPARWRDRVWPYEAALSAEETLIASTGTFLEMIRNGTTCFSDPGTLEPEAVARAADQTGIRGIVARMTWDVHDPAAPVEFNDDTATALARAEDCVQRCSGLAGGRVRAWLSLVRADHVSDQLVRDIKRRADALKVGIHAHLSTTRGQVEAALHEWGKTPVARYRDLGALGTNTHLVHMGAITDEDVAILKGFDPSICHCPSASMFGGFGCIAHGKFPELIENGMRVVLGTDACAISRFIDMVRIMYLASCAHKDVKTDPTVIGAHKAMEMATIDGAKALMWDQEIGSLECGKLADVVIADADGIEWQPNPMDLPVANLIYSASGSCVRTVIIDGHIVMDERRITMIDEQDFVVRATACASTIFTRLHFKPRTVWPVC